MKSQANLILEALKAGESITPLDALNRFSCFRLGARIFDLRKKGYDIVNVGSNDGNYACYKLRYPNPIPHLPPAFPPKVYNCHAGSFHEVGCPHDEGKVFAARAAEALLPSKPKVESNQMLF